MTEIPFHNAVVICVVLVCSTFILSIVVVGILWGDGKDQND